MIVPYFQGNVDAVGGIFLPVHNALLKARGGFGPVHVDRVCAQGAKRINKDRAAHHANFQALHIFRLGNGAFAGGHFAIAVFSPAENFDALAFNGGDQHCTRLAGGNGVYGLVAVWLHSHEKGQSCKVQFLDLRRPVDGRCQGKVNCAVAQHEKFGSLLACQQLAGGVDLDIDAPVGALVHQFRKAGCRETPPGCCAGYHAEFVFRLVGRRSCLLRQCGQHAARQQADEHNAPCPTQKALHKNGLLIKKVNEKALLAKSYAQRTRKPRRLERGSFVLKTRSLRQPCGPMDAGRCCSGACGRALPLQCTLGKKRSRAKFW